MKIIRKMMLVIVISVSMIISINAEILAPAMNSPTRIAFLGGINGLKVARTYGADGVSEFYVASDYPCPAYALWMSNMYAETIYKMTLTMPNWGTQLGETGFMDHTDDYAAYLIPAENMLAGLDLSEAKYGTNQSYQPTWESLETFRLPNDQYEIFWDRTNRQLSCIFYNDAVTTNTYIMIRMGTWQTGDYVGGLAINSDITKGPLGIYTDILQDIKKLLEEMLESSGGNLTGDMIDEAIVEALDKHDQQLQSDVQQQGTQADQIVEQLGDIVPAIKLQTALQGLTAAVSGNHRTCVLVLPEIIEPVTGAMIMEETPVDLTGMIQGIINGDSRIGILVDLIRWINLLVLAFSLFRSIMNIINYVTSGGDQA